MLTDLQVRRRNILKAMMAEDLWNEAIAEAKSNIVHQLLSTPAIARDEREALYNENLALDRVLGRLNAMVGDLSFLPKPKPTTGATDG